MGDVFTYRGQNKAWKLKEQGDENQYAQRKVSFKVHVPLKHAGTLCLQDQELLATLRAQMERDAKEAASRTEKNFEGGYGGQEDLEDRYATTSGEH